MDIHGKSTKYIQIGEFRDNSSEAHQTNEEFKLVVQKMAEQRSKIDQILVRSRSYQTQRQLINNPDDSYSKNAELLQENNDKEMTFGGGGGIQRQRDRSVGSINKQNSLISKIQGYEIEANSTVHDMRRRIQSMKTKKGEEGWSPQEELYRLTNDFSRIDIRKQGKHASHKKNSLTKQSRTDQNPQTLSSTISQLSPLSNNSPSIQFEIIEPQLNNASNAIKSANKLVFNPSQQVSSQKQPETQSPKRFSYASIPSNELNRPRSLMKQVKTQQGQFKYPAYLQQEDYPNKSYSLQKIKTLPRIYDTSNSKKLQLYLDDLNEQQNLRLDHFSKENSPSKGILLQNENNDSEVFRINNQRQEQKNIHTSKRTRRAKSSLGKFEAMINHVRGAKREEIKKVYMGVPEVEGSLVWKTSESKTRNKGARKRCKTRLELLENDVFKIGMEKEKIPAIIMDNLSEFNYLSDNSPMRGQSKQEYSDEMKRNNCVNFNLYYTQHEDLMHQQSKQILEMLHSVYQQSQFMKKAQFTQQLAEFKQNFTLLAEKQDQCSRKIKMQHQHFNSFYMPSEYDLTGIP